MRTCPRCQAEGLKVILFHSYEGTMICLHCRTVWEIGSLGELISKNTDDS